MSKHDAETARVLAGQVAKELETYLVERRIERAEALLFVNRHLVYDALIALSQGGAAAPDLLVALGNARDRIEQLRDPEANGPWDDRLKREIDQALLQSAKPA